MTALQLLLNKSSDKSELYNCVLFALGKFVSVFGSIIYTFAIGLYVLELTGSGLNFAITLVLGTIPIIIISPFAGVLADRFDKKKLVVTMDLMNGVLLITFYILSSFFGVQLVMIYASTFLMNIFTTIFSVSLKTAIKNIVTDKMLIKLNSISKIMDSASSILGPIVGGLIFAYIDIRLFIFINGLSFIFSAISELFINFKFNADIKSTVKNKFCFTKDIKEGIKYILDSKELISILSINIFVYFFIGLSITVPLPFIINNVLELDAVYYGIINTGYPIGMIIGAIFVKRVRKNISCLKLLWMMSLLLSFCMMLIGVPLLFSITGLQAVTYSIYYIIIMIIIGGTLALIDIPIIYEVQTIVPSAYLGRVVSIGMSGIRASLPIALITSGVLVNVLPAAFLPITGGSLLLIVNMIILKNIPTKSVSV